MIKYSLALICIAFTLNSADTTTINDLSWSTPDRGISKYISKKTQEKYTLAGSKLSLTMEEIDNKYNAPEWFPSKTKMPNIVKYGKSPKVWACASCHLSSGMGHPESARLAGLSSEYMQSQLKSFASKKRIVM